MALLAEEVVEEWLNRQGFFTIRGAKIGVQEMDLLAVRFTDNGIECRQVEVQASVNPISYLTPLQKEVQKKTGRGPANAKRRSDDELRRGVREWIQKKYDHSGKKALRERLAPGRPWTRELVVHRLKYEVERKMIVDAGVTVWDLSDVVADLQRGNALLQGAAGAHLVELVALTAATSLADPSSATR
jgi:hypothetical protein